MVLGEDTLDEAAPASTPAAEAAEIDDSPTAYNLEMMESILQRLQPNDCLLYTSPSPRDS